MTQTAWEQDRETAWSELEQRLTDWLEAVPPDGFVLFTADLSDLGDEDEGPPWVQLVIEGLTVEGRVSGSACLLEMFRLNRAQLHALDDLGWVPLARDDVSDLGCDGQLPEDAGELAHRVVATLRDVHGVIDPCFLVVDGRQGDHSWDEDDLPLGLRMCEPDEESPVDTTAVAVSSPDDLRDAVAEVVTDETGEPAEFDADGDIPVPAADTVVYVRVSEDAPSVQLFAALAQDVRWTPRVGHTLNEINGRLRFARVTFAAGYVTVSHTVDCVPYTPQHMRRALGGMCELVAGLGEHVRTTVGGRSLAEDADDST